MINGKKQLKGLNVDDFRHEDEAALEQAVLKRGFAEKAVSALADISVMVNEANLLGQMILMTEETAPMLYGILRDVCRILDCEKIPRIYLRHSWIQCIATIESGDTYIMMDDFIAENYDTDMLYYCLGNAVSVIKAGQVRYTTIAAYMLPSSPLSTIAKLGFMPFVHAMDMTSDRCGLLACQSFGAALRCMLVEAGVPVSEAKKLFRTDIEAEKYAETYLRETERISAETSGRFRNVARKIQVVQSGEGAVNEMLRDLFFWYRSENGYRMIMKKYGV